MPNIHPNISASATLLALIVASAAALTSCSDNEPYCSADKSRITFNVTGTSEWNALKGNRSDSHPCRSVTEMTGGTGSLYLIGQRLNGIESEPVTSSRADGVTTSTISDFGVFAAMTDGSGSGTDGLQANYMNNVEITRENGWSPALDYSWPTDGFLHINAFSPYTSVISDYGVTALPGSDETGGLTLGYRVPEDPVDQQDLMWASPVDASSSPCNLTFNHALTAVKFVAGSKLTPCTVTHIFVTGINGQGTLNIETGEWSDLAGQAVYEITPTTTLTAAEGSQFVEASTPLASADETLMLIPQTLPQGAAITLSVEIDGVSTDFTADISGSEWLAGTTMIYRLSASAESQDLILEVVDDNGNRISSISSPYTGDSFKFHVNSYCNTGSDAPTEIEWEAELIDASGNTISAMPLWVKDYTVGGKGASDLEFTTRLTEPVFLEMSDHTKALREAADINTISGVDTYNLAGKEGASGIDNTANCYLINAPGHYSIPLVYGNAIKDGTANEAAYKSTLSNTTANRRRALFNFINHLGNEITDPYIYNNADCEPAGAELIWEERIGTVSNVALTSDAKSIVFDIPAGFIRQSNAIVAVTDAKGQIMWSWHLWITDYVAGTQLHGVEANGSTGMVYPINIGRIYGGDKTEFQAAEATLRLTQKNVPDGMTPLTANIAVSQAGTTISTKDCCSFYQWGRKDPMIAAVENYYNAAGDIMSGASMPTVDLSDTHAEVIENTILNPGKYISATNADVNRLNPFYQNLWDINNLVTSPQNMQPENIKTIYDPSPVGAKVPVGNEFRALETGTYDAATNCKTFEATDGSTIMLNMFGYRELSGRDIFSSEIGGYWTAISGGGTRTMEFIITQTNHKIQINDAFFGFAVRPVAE